MNKFINNEIKELKGQLYKHSVYEAIEDLEDLKIFMQHHIYSVWDFMSLVKYLQNNFAPTTTPWKPSRKCDVQRFINEIVMEEESDKNLILEESDVKFISHFELYMHAMEEVEIGSSKSIQSFLEELETKPLDIVIDGVNIPSASRKFVKTTFNFLKSDKPHIIAAAFSFGREHIIPYMYSDLLTKMKIDENDAKRFHYYINRHIELDGGSHGEMAMKMLDILCADDPQKIDEVQATAIKAIQARIHFWDGVLIAIQEKKRLLEQLKNDMLIQKLNHLTTKSNHVVKIELKHCCS